MHQILSIIQCITLWNTQHWSEPVYPSLCVIFFSSNPVTVSWLLTPPLILGSFLFPLFMLFYLFFFAVIFRNASLIIEPSSSFRECETGRLSGSLFLESPELPDEHFSSLFIFSCVNPHSNNCELNSATFSSFLLGLLQIKKKLSGNPSTFISVRLARNFKTKLPQLIITPVIYKLRAVCAMNCTRVWPEVKRQCVSRTMRFGMISSCWREWTWRSLVWTITNNVWNLYYLNKIS